MWKSIYWYVHRLSVWFHPNDFIRTEERRERISKVLRYFWLDARSFGKKEKEMFWHFLLMEDLSVRQRIDLADAGHQCKD